MYYDVVHGKIIIVPNTKHVSHNSDSYKYKLKNIKSALL